MPDDDELLAGASRVVHGIEQAGNVRGPQIAAAPDHQHRPSVLPDEPPNLLHRRHRVLGPFEHAAPLLQPVRLPELQAPQSVRYLTVRMVTWGWAAVGSATDPA
jgi:hypothetical protein